MRRSLIAGAVAACTCLAAAQPLGAQDVADVVEQHNAAWTEGDFEAFMATFAEDAVVIYDGVELRGREQIAQTYAPDFAPGAPRNHITRQGRGAGGAVVREESYIFSDGSEECCTVSAIYVQDGQVARVIVRNRGG